MTYDNMWDYMQGYLTPEFDRQLFALNRDADLRENPARLALAQQAMFMEAWDRGAQGGRRETSPKAMKAKAKREPARRRNFFESLRQRVLPDTPGRLLEVERKGLNRFRVGIVERADLRGATPQEMDAGRYTALRHETLALQAFQKADEATEVRSARQARDLLFLATLSGAELAEASKPGRTMPEIAPGEVAKRMSSTRFIRDMERRMDAAARGGNHARVAEFMAAAYDLATRLEPGIATQEEARRLWQRAFNHIKAAPLKRPMVAVRTVDELRPAVGDLLGNRAVAEELDEEALRAIAAAKGITRLYQRTHGELVRDMSAVTLIPVAELESMKFKDDELRRTLAAVRKAERITLTPPPRMREGALPKTLSAVQDAYAARNRPITQADVMAAQRRIRDAFPVLSALLPTDRLGLTEEIVSRELMGQLDPGTRAQEVALRRLKDSLGDDPHRPTTIEDLVRLAALNKNEWRKRIANAPTEPDPTYAGRLPDSVKTPVQTDIKAFLAQLAAAEGRRSVAIGQELPAVPEGFFAP